MNYLRQKDNAGNNKYYIVASCGSGLFTTGGHYIVLVADSNGVITVYDPYLYNGKFNTASRRNAGVVVSGNSAFVSEEAFKQYANYKYFWIYSNDVGYGNVALDVKTDMNLTRYVATQRLNLLVREKPNGTILNRLARGTQVNVVELNGEWARINSPYSGWVHSEYLSSSPVIQIQNTVGNYYRLKNRSTLYSNSNLSGIEYNYLAQTQIKVLENVSDSIDKIKVIKTGRIAYINKSAYTISGATGQIRNTVGHLYRLKRKTTLYANPEMNGTQYNYLPQTQIKVLKNYNSSIDYIQVVKTGRKAYCYSNSY